MADGVAPLPNALWALAVCTGLYYLETHSSMFCFLKKDALVGKSAFLSHTGNEAHDNSRVIGTPYQSHKYHNTLLLKVLTDKVHSTL